MYRFTFLLFSVLLLGATASFAQLNPMGQQAGVTRAVVIGVSEFQQARIPRLQFAHTDAQAFADYLRSPAGGSLPDTRLKLLVNQQATQGQMATALTWLMEESREGDQAIIFFSGHGDMENQTFAKHGFLLTYDAPAAMYMAGGAFPVVYLQSILQTLSVYKKVQVVLITDACHAGKLAGTSGEANMQGSQATAQQLAEQFANEVRLLSCQPNEFSREGRQWGDGHGVFTYYLLDGLSGLADVNGDNTVTLMELQRYLEDEVPAAVAPDSQIPMVFGNKGVKMAKVDAATLSELIAKRTAQEQDGTDVRGMAHRSPQQTVSSDSTVWALYRQFNVALAQEHLLYPEENSAYSLYLRLRDEPAMAAFRQEMRLSLSAALQDEAQRAINDYLAANPVELRRRWNFDERYLRYPAYLETAAALLGEDHFMYRELNARALYFRGINLRLQGEREDEAVLFAQAYDIQTNVILLDSMAAYAYNELGLLARRRGQYAESVPYFQQALRYSPTWVLALTNLCGSYVDMDEYLLAEGACQQALRFDSTFALAHHNQGAAFKAQQMWTAALSAYEQALRYAPDYPTTHSSMAEVYYFTGDKSAARVAWQQSLAWLPNQVDVLYNLGYVNKEMAQPDTALAYFQAVVALNPQDRDAHLEVALVEMDLRDFEAAAQTLAIVRELEDAPDYTYALARWQVLQGHKQEALTTLEQAFAQGFDDKEMLKTDAAWNSIRQDGRFKAMER